MADIHLLPASVRATYTADNLLLKDRKKEKRYNEQPTHKTAHLQTAQTDTRPKFAKELFSCLHTR